MNANPNFPEPAPGFGHKIADALQGLVTDVPVSTEVRLDNPRPRADKLASQAAIKAASLAASIAIIPGPLGILTIIPSLIGIWKIQRQVVADIAACYGRTRELSAQVMLYCLFQHGAATVFKETVVQVGGRLLIKDTSVRAIQQVIQKVSVHVSQRVIGQFISRWLPVVGSVAIGAFAHRDTRRIARTTILAFEKEFAQEELAGGPFIDITPSLPPIPTM